MKFHPEIMGRPRYFVFTENILEHIFKKFLTDGEEDRTPLRHQQKKICT